MGAIQKLLPRAEQDDQYNELAAKLGMMEQAAQYNDLVKLEKKLGMMEQAAQYNDLVKLEKKLGMMEQAARYNFEVTLPTASQGTVTLPRADQSGGGGEGVSSAASVPAVQAPPFVPAYAASHAPTLGARNIEAVQADMDGVDRVIQGLKERQRDLNGQADLYGNRESAWGRLGYVDLDGKDARQAEQLRLQAKELDGQIAQLERNKAGLQEEWNQADQRQFEALRQTAGFKAVVDKVMSAPYGTSVNSRKPSHRDVWNATAYFQAKAAGNESLAAAARQDADMALERMDEGQRDRLIYYVGIGDYDGAADYLHRIIPALNREQMEALERRVSEWAQEHPIQGALTNVVSWPLNIPAYAANTRQAAKNLITGKDEQDPHVSAYGLTKIGTGTAQGTQEAARSAATQTFGSETAGDVAAFLAGTGLSVGQNATQIALLGPYSLAGMSISAAGSATADALDRGATPRQAFLVGTSSGVIEAVAEKIPLDNLFRLAKEGGGKGVKAAVIELLKQMGIEATEEMASEIANNVVDLAVMGDSSEYQMYVRELQAAGLSRKEAEQQAFQQFYVWNVLLAGAGGAISGVAMGGGAMTFHQAGQYVQQLNAGKQGAAQANAAIDRAYQAMVEKGMFSQEAGQAVQEAQEKMGKGVALLPTGERALDVREGIILPGGEVASLEGQQPVGPSLQAEGSPHQASEGDALRGQLTPHPSVQAPQAAGQTAETSAREIVSESGTTAPGTQSSSRAEDIQFVIQNLRESLNRGDISEEQFIGSLDSIMEHEGLEGLDMLDTRRFEGGTGNGTGDFGTAAPGGEQLPGGRAERAFDQGAGGQDGVLAEGGSRRAADTGRAAVNRQNAAGNLQLETVSSRELGVAGGTDERTVRLLPEDAWDGELRGIARKVRRETGLGVRFVLGGIQVTGTGQSPTVQVRGVYTTDGIIVQADHLRVSATQIADHEIFHSYAQQDPGLIQAVEEAIAERYGPEELYNILAEYAKDLRGIVDVSDDSALDFEQAYADIKNEVFADAFAGINAFGAHAEQYQDAVLETLEERGAASPWSRENAQAMDSRTGPPTQQFSYEGKTEDGIEVYETSEEVRNLPYKQRMERFMDIMRGEYAGRTAKFTANNGETYYAKFDEADLRKNIYGDKRSSQRGWKAKINTGADGSFFELLENAQHDRSGAERGKAPAAHQGLTGWEYFVKTVQIDGRVYDLLANVRKKADGEYVYSIQLSESKNKAPALPRQYRDGTAQSGESRPVGVPTDAFSKFDADNITKPHEGTGDRRSALASESTIAQTGEAVKGGGLPLEKAGRGKVNIVNPQSETDSQATSSTNSIARSGETVKGGGLFWPTADEGTATLPKGEGFGQTRFSVDEDQDAPVSDPGTFADGIMLNKGEVLDGSMLPTLAEAQTRRQQAETEARQGNVSDSGTSDDPARSAADTLPAKARDYLQKVERRLMNKVGDLLSVPKSARREFLQDIVRSISNEYLSTGQVAQETRDQLFEQAYEQGVQVDREYYDTYKHVRDYLRSTPITVSEWLKGDIDDYNEWRKGAFGTLRLVKKGGNGPDTAYMELQHMAPGLFPDSITHPADQLRHILETARGIRVSEQSLKEAYGPEAEEFKRWSRRDFDEAVADALGDLKQVKRYADERTQQAEAAQAPMTVQEVTELWGRVKGARRVYEVAAARNLLTQHDEIQVGRLLRGELELEHLDPARDNVKGITAVYEAKLEYEELAGRIRQWNQQRKAALREQADGFLESANDWKDKAAGILYSRETMERNIRDIVPDQELADQINRAYFQPVHDAAAKANRAKNEYRDRVRELKLSRKAAKGDLVSEAHAVQLLGEAEDNIQMLENSRVWMKERDGKTLEDWRGVVQNLWAENPGLDQEKIRGAVQEFRAIYDELFQQMNEARVRNGYEPVNYRKGYFPHFQPGGEGIVALFGKALGIDTAVNTLPTTINGLTHTFKPGIQWFGNAQERLGFNTVYDAVEGFDRYIEGVADVIYQTDNIQALRALGAQARYRTGDDGLRKQVDKVRADPNLTEEQKQNEIDKIHQEGKFALNNFVVELDEYTNLLANKKSRGDRDMEQRMGRRMYRIMKGLEGRVAANMVAVNPASWLTNFVPLTQGGASLDRGMLLKGMWGTLKAYHADDGIVGMSSFLTNRRGSDPLVKTWSQSASAALSSPMEYIDQFTADSLVRGRYQQNLKHGMSEAAAMEEADAWAAGVMADRSKGAMPTLFGRTNPLTKLFTQFQLEVNNQLSYLFKDLPREWKKKGLAAMCAMLFKFLVGAYLYNDVYEYFIGRRCALDPIGILNDTVGDLTGYELPNVWEMAVDAAQGKEISFETEKKDAYEAAAGLFGNVAEELPFIGGVLGGGRVPINSALPDWGNLAKAALNDGWSNEKRLATAAKELGNPLTYMALPFGGGQIKKIYQGLKAVSEGGSYTVDNEGRNILQYPVFNETPGDTLLALPTALTFGKSALPTAREWAESGFKSLNAKQTACYQGMTELGVPQRDAFKLIQALGKVREPEDEDVAATERAAYQKRKLLEDADISAEGKSVVYYGLMASDKERALMDELAEGGADMGETARVLMELKDANALEDGKSAAKKNAITASSLSEEEKDAMFRYVLGADSPGAAYSKTLADAGLDKRTAAAVANALNGLTPEKGAKTVSDAQKWRAVLDTAGSAEDQKAALLAIMSDSARTRFEVADSFGIEPEAWVRLKEALPQFDADGNGSYTGAEVENAIDALGGNGALLAPWDKDPLRLSREEKAALWQAFTGNKSGSGNPYSTRVGKQVAQELEEAREEAKGKDNE